MANKTCVKCNQSKPLSDFYKANYNYKTNKDGHDYYCKYCRKGSHLASMRANKKKCSLESCDKPHYAKTYCRMHYARAITRNNVERSIDSVDISKSYFYNGKTTLYTRNRMLMLKYKITLEEYQERTADGCELCGEISNISYHVDHDHLCCKGQKTCGKCVRGIICHKCNIAVDKMQNGVMRQDYPNYWLIQKYLEAYRGQKRT